MACLVHKKYKRMDMNGTVGGEGNEIKGKHKINLHKYKKIQHVIL